VHLLFAIALLSLYFILFQGFSSVMVDGSHLSFNENAAYTKFISLLAHSNDMLVEAELGRLSGTEDDLTVEEYEAKLTDVNMVSISSTNKISKYSSYLKLLNLLMLVSLISGGKIH
jgi:hypothetical protein